MSYTSTLPYASGVIASTDQIDWSNPVAVTDTANLNFGKHHVVTVTAADKTLTLPAVSGNGGKMLSIEIASTTTKLITIDGNASETIDAATTRIMRDSETCLLLCNGTTWTKIAGKSIPMKAVLCMTTPGQTFNNSTFTLLTYNTLQTANAPAAFYDAANAKLIALRPSKLNVRLSVPYEASNASNTFVAAKIIKNVNTDVIYGFFPYLANMYGAAIAQNIIDVATNDYIRPYGYYGAGSYSGAATFFNIIAGTFSAEEILSW